jgi:DNA repair protein RecO (recombination protein O)
MTQFRDRGVVLRTIRLGEADRIVTLMTEHHGKVRAVAKGVRRTTSKFGSRLEPMSHVALLGWQGRGDLDTINQVEVIDTFRPVREDLDRMSAALSMLEVVDQVGQERHANPRLYEMSVRALGALAERNSAMVAPAFFLKVLALEGSAPFLDGCVSCGEEDDGQLPGLPPGPTALARRPRPAAPHPRWGPVRGARRAPLGRHRRGDRLGHRGHRGPSGPSAPVGPGRTGLLSTPGTGA